MEFQEKIENNIAEEILASFSKNKIFGKINEGLSQGGKIIIPDATTTSLGYIVSYYASTIYHRITLGIQKAIKDSIDLAKSNSEGYVPILMLAESIDHDCNFRLSTLRISCLIIKGDNGLQVDLSRLRPINTTPKWVLHT